MIKLSHPVKLILLTLITVNLTACIETSLIEGCDKWSVMESQANQTAYHSVCDGEGNGLTGDELDMLISAKNISSLAYKKYLEQDIEDNKENFKENVRMVLAGDSWAFFDIVYKATEDKLHIVNPKYNLEYLNYTTDSKDTSFVELLGKPGSRAKQWSHRNNYQKIVHTLLRNQDAKVLLIYLGGNDWVDAYHCNEDVLNKKKYQEIANNLNKIILRIQAAIEKAQPGRKIHYVISGYSKLNFEESLEYKTNKYRYRKMGFGVICDETESTVKINKAFKIYLDTIEENLLNLNSEIRPDNNTQTRQYVHFVDNFSIFDTDISKPTAVEHMLYVYIDFWVTRSYRFIDSIHLGRKAQHKLAAHTMQYVLDNHLLD